MLHLQSWGQGRVPVRDVQPRAEDLKLHPGVGKERAFHAEDSHPIAHAADEGASSLIAEVERNLDACPVHDRTANREDR
jgi:hypothetical protein